MLTLTATIPVQHRQGLRGRMDGQTLSYFKVYARDEDGVEHVAEYEVSTLANGESIAFRDEGEEFFPYSVELSWLGHDEARRSLFDALDHEIQLTFTD